jgi:hypothetical protein
VIRPVLFLDFDDVICLNRTCGGYDAIHAIARIETEPGLPSETFDTLWTELFDVNAKAFLQAIHDVHGPYFVLTTSWCRFVKKESLVEILKCSGLGFIAENLHSSWATPRRMHPDIRAGEIGSWHRANPGFENSWVILDDEVSGGGLSDWPIPIEQPFIILCRESVGLTDVEYQKLKTAFLLRAKLHLFNRQPR